MNLPRIAMKVKGDKDKFMEELTNLYRITARINNCKRILIKKRIDSGAAPLYSLNLKN